jgi:RND family efflux transporter MFP subunit
VRRRAFLERKIWLPLAILGIGVLGVGALVATRPRVEPAPPDVPAPLVRAVRVEPQPLQFTVRAHGTVVPRTESELVPQVSGEVVWVSPALVSGGFFEAGQPLVRIDPADYEADLRSARAVTARAQSEHRRTTKELERQRQLADRSVASEARIDDAENAFRAAGAALREAEARLERAARDLERTELQAPYAGRVREEHVDVGQFVTRGVAIATLYAVDYAEVRLPIPDRELAYVDLPLAYRPEGGSGDETTPAAASAGPLVRLRAEFAGRDHVWTGRIVRTEGEIDAKSRMVNAVARVEDPYAREVGSERPPLAVGLFVEAEILGRRIDAAVVLPRPALRRAEAAPGGPARGGHFVLVVTGDSRLEFRPVQVLRTERERAVIGAGLAGGERVCVSPLRAPVDGMAVRVADEKTPDLAKTGSPADASDEGRP